MKEDRRECTETAALTGGCAGDAVAAAASKKPPQAVVVKDFEPSEVLNTHRPRLAAVEQNRPNLGLVGATLGLERYLPSGPPCRFQADKSTTRKPIHNNSRVRNYRYPSPTVIHPGDFNFHPVPVLSFEIVDGWSTEVGEILRQRGHPRF